MPPLLIAGMAVIALGAFVWVISSRLARFAVQSKTYVKPGIDQPRERRRTVIWIRTIGSLQALFGLGIVIYWAIRVGR